MTKATEEKMSTINKVSIGITVTLMGSIIIGGFKAYNQLSVIASKLESIEKVTKERHGTLEGSVASFKYDIQKRVDKLEERMLFAERKLK